MGWWRRLLSAFCIKNPKQICPVEYMAVRAMHFILMVGMVKDEKANQWRRT